VSQGMPGREGSRCLTRQEQVASYSRALVMTAATATILKAAVLLRRMSLSRSRVCPGVCTKAHEGVFQGAPRGGAHTSPPLNLQKACNQNLIKTENLLMRKERPPIGTTTWFTNVTD